jgi:hypothetical protein
MLKTYRIIPLVFILFLFGFTLITVSPVFAQTVDQLIERIEKLEAAVFPQDSQTCPLCGKPTLTPVPSKIDGPWNPSMGMCHNSRPCMIANSCGVECTLENRSSKGWVQPTLIEARDEVTGVVCKSTQCYPQEDDYK